MPLEYLISAAVTLFVVVDPIGLAPTFLSVPTGIPDPPPPAFPSPIRRLGGPGSLPAPVLRAGQAAFRPLYAAVMVGVIAAIVALCLLVLSTCSTVSNLRSWWRITPSSAKYRASLCFSRMSPADPYMSFGAFRRAAQNRPLW